jgi:hypothetical protein
LTIPTAEELKAASDTRTVKGIIEAVSGVLLAVGSIAICVVTCGTATPVVAAVSVIAGSIATTYAISNIVEGVSDIYYGVNGDITSSAINPVKDLIVKAVGDDKTGTIIYHAIGISASLIQHLLMPINAGLQLANLLHAGIGQTIYIITRVVAVEVVKMAVTAGLSYLTSIGLSKVTTKLTGSEAAGLLVGYTGALIVGFVTYNGLTALDKKFNFSGIYVKAGLGKAYIDTKLRDSALKHFNESEWNNMTLAEKKANIQQLAKIIADELGLENAPKVKYYYEMDNTYGYYYDGDNTLNINTYYFTKGDAPYVEIVDTIAHETRHAYQYARLLNGVYDDISESYVHYISADTNKALYYSQACEVDAFGYGEYWANLLQGVLGV